MTCTIEKSDSMVAQSSHIVKISGAGGATLSSMPKIKKHLAELLLESSLHGPMDRFSISDWLLPRY